MYTQMRLLNVSEIDLVSGGGDSVCPVDEGWNPNWLTDDAGNIQDMPTQNGPYDRYWTDGTTWCLYDSSNNLLGEYKEDPNGSLTITWGSTDGSPSINGSVAGTGVGGTSNDSSTGSYTVTLSKK
jgi:hypothetical protein